MMNRKTIYAFVLALLTLFHTSAFGAESQWLIEKNETGIVNWTTGVIQAKGIGNPRKKDSGNTQTNIRKILSEAKNNARHNLYKTANKIKIESKLTVMDISAKNQAIMTQIKDMAYDASEIKTLRKYMSDGSVEVHLQMSMHGGFTQLVLPQEIKQIESIKQIKPEENSYLAKTAGAPKSGKYTGLVVDCRGIDAVPALVFKLLDENLEEVFGPAFVSREFVVQRGMAAYYTDIQAAQADERVANYPLLVKALRTDWPSRCNFIISNTDAAKLRSASEHLLFLKESRVVIVLSPLSSR